MKDNKENDKQCDIQIGEEDVGGVEHIFANVFVDIDTIEEQTSCA